MWLTVLCADNRGAQNHHRGEGTQNAVHGRHSTNAAAYTIAILPKKIETMHKTTTSSLPTLHGMFRIPPPWFETTTCSVLVPYLILKSLYGVSVLLVHNCYTLNVMKKI